MAKTSIFSLYVAKTSWPKRPGQNVRGQNVLHSTLGYATAEKPGKYFDLQFARKYHANATELKAGMMKGAFLTYLQTFTAQESFRATATSIHTAFLSSLFMFTFARHGL